jgi:beta-glucosidase-like glycosyl hydrolase
VIPATSLSLDTAIGQLICPTGFGGQLRRQPWDEAAVLEELDRYGWGGYIVFHEAAEVVAGRIATLQAHSRLRLLVAADMEHGAGQQAHGLSLMPPAMAYGATGDPACSEALGAWTGYEARQVGVNWVFAPVADVTNNPYNPIIAIRSFGGDPQAVARHVAAFVRGCQGQGVLACAKHFPGHGDTAADSHSRLATVPADRERLEAVEWPPFRSAIESGVASVMSAHVAVPALDAPDVPATLSRPVMTGLLRETWGYDGLVVTDALLMGGITTVRDAAEAGVAAVLAGCDMLLMPPDPIALYDALRQAVHDGRLGEQRVYEAVGRILAAKARLNVPAPAVPAGDPQAHARDVARRAITLAKGPTDWQLPQNWGIVTVLDGTSAEDLAPWLQGLAALHPAAAVTVSPASTAADWQALREQAATWPGTLIAVASPIRVSKDRSLLPADLVEQLQAVIADRPSAVVAMSSPFLVAQFPASAVWVCSYGTGPDQQTALLTALQSGEFPGRLAVTLPSSLQAPATVWSTATRLDLGPPFA